MRSRGDDSFGSAERADRESGARPTTRRQYLAGTAGLFGAALTAGCAATPLGVPWRTGAVRPLGAVATDGDRRTALDPDRLDAEPMRTEVREHDGTAVLYQYGQPVPSFDTWRGNAAVRDHRSLDGTWRFRFDPNDRGVADGWHAPDHDDDGWDAVPVPLPWDLHDTPAFASYDGTHYGDGTAFRDGFAWYRRRFVPDAALADRRVRLHALGASYMCWVFLDGELVCQHEGGHTPFAVDVTDHVEPGEPAHLAVRVYRRPWWDAPTAAEPQAVVDATDVPAKPVDFWPYAGLTRSVYLEGTAPASVCKLLTDARDGELVVRCVVQNRGDRTVDRVLTVDPDPATGAAPVSRSLRLAPGEVRVPTVTVALPDASPWTPATPTTYEATATLRPPGRGDVTDALSTTYGVRAVTADDGQLALNGDAVFLKGLNWHEETAARGRSLRPTDYDDVLARVRALGANFLRNSHYNRHPYAYEACDDAGVVVLDEGENVWLDEPHQRAQLRYGLSRALVAAMVWNQHNHPSVALWSLQNECDAASAVYGRWLGDLRDVVRALDCQDRPVTWAAKTPLDPQFEHADVVGLNEYYGYVHGHDDLLGVVLDALHRRYPDTPVLITENGTWSAPERRRTNAAAADPDAAAEARPGDPAWQAAKLRAHWAQVTAPQRASYVAGYAYWALADYKTRLQYNRFSYNGISTMGLQGFGGTGKTRAYAAFQDAAIPDR